MPLMRKLVGNIGTGVGAVAEYNQQHQRRPTPQFTPSASEAGDSVLATSPSAQTTHLQDAPPTYAESVDHGSVRLVASGPSIRGENKVQYDDDLDEEDEDSSDLDDDGSDITLSALVDDDEAAWVLDEYAAAHNPPSYEDATNVPSEDDLVREIIAGQRAHQRDLQRSQLPCPVILPQRRPRNKSRGFVRAYAPVLQNVGIDQTTFLKFLYNLHKSTQASPWFTVIEVSGAAAGAAGPAIGFAVRVALKTAANVGRNLEVAYKSNNFLDRMNAELFRPAGTFAFLMKYKINPDLTPEDTGLFGVAAANINLTTNQVVAKYDRDGGVQGVDGLVNKMQMFRLAAGTTEGADDLPASAPLIFPEIDDEIKRSGSESLQDKASGMNPFMQDYLDRRAQIRFSREDPNSALASPEEQMKMKSPLADPDHPMFNNGIIGLLSGGYIVQQARLKGRHGWRDDGSSYSRTDRRQQRREARSERKHERREAHAEREAERSQRKLGRGMRKLERGYNLSPASSSASVPREPAPSLASQQTGSTTTRGRRRHGHRRRGGRALGTVKKLMTEDVIYLMIVNLPEEENDVV